MGPADALPAGPALMIVRFRDSVSGREINETKAPSRTKNVVVGDRFEADRRRRATDNSRASFFSARDHRGLLYHRQGFEWDPGLRRRAMSQKRQPEEGEVGASSDGSGSPDEKRQKIRFHRSVAPPPFPPNCPMTAWDFSLGFRFGVFLK